MQVITPQVLSSGHWYAKSLRAQPYDIATTSPISAVADIDKHRTETVTAICVSGVIRRETLLRRQGRMRIMLVVRLTI